MANLILLFLLNITQVLGDIWLSKAMKQFGEVNLVNSESWIPLIIYLLTNFWIWLGVIFLMLSLGLYLTVISRSLTRKFAQNEKRWQTGIPSTGARCSH